MTLREERGSCGFVIDAQPPEIDVIPRGIRYRLDLPDGGARRRLRELRRAARGFDDRKEEIAKAINWRKR